MFHIKLTLFVIVAVLSIFPTIKFLNWRNLVAQGETVDLSKKDTGKLLMFIRIELLLLAIIPLLAVSLRAETPANPAIDYAGFAKLTMELQPVREKNRVSEEEFIRMAAEPGTIILDARTKRHFEHIHVKVRPEGGAEVTSQLYFPDQPVEGLTVTLEQRGDYFVGYFNFVVQK